VGKIKTLLSNGKIKAAVELLKGFKDGKTELEREELLYALRSPEPKVAYWAVKALLVRNPSLMEELLDVKKVSRAVEFDFPVVGGKRELIRAVAFKSSRTMTNKKDASLFEVESFLNSKVAVFFEETEFVGSSFQAPLAYALYGQGFPQSLLLSGSLNPNGDFEAERAEEKRKIALKNARFLVWKGNVKELHSLFSKELVNLPLFIALGEREKNRKSLELLKETYSLDCVKGIDWERLIIPLPERLPAGDWLPFVRATREVFLELLYFPSSLSLHIALKTPSALAFGSGIALGAVKLKVAIYHYEGGNYHRVINLLDSPRKIKKRVRELELLNIKSEERGKDVAVVALQIASHETEGKGRQLAEELGADFFYIEAVDKGALPLKGWEKLVAEAYEALNRIYSTKNYKEINLLMSVPVPVAFALGMAVGSYWPIKVWHFFKELNGYSPVLEAREVEPI